MDTCQVERCRRRQEEPPGLNPAADGAELTSVQDLIAYWRSASSPLVDMTVSPIFLPRVPLMNPRTLWACQPVALISSFRVPPSGRFSRSRILAALLPSRTVLAFLPALG